MWILASSFEGDPHCGTPKFCQILSFHVCLFWKFSSVQGEWFSFEFWRLRFRGILLFWYPQIFSNFILSSFCLSWKLLQSSVSGEILSFGVLVWREFLSFWYPEILSNFIFFLYLPILKISCVKHEWLKSWSFGGPVWEVPRILICPNSVKFYLFFIFANPIKFHVSSKSG